MPDVVTAIRDSLNAHYNPAVVEWKVDVKGSAVTVPSITPEGFKAAGSGLFARYTSDMRKVINAFEQQHGAIGKDDLCLFFVDVADQSRDGFMPLDGQYGFIFNFNNDPATVAHELAHGAFNLRHTFSSKAQHYLPEKTTHNLLDYANGTELWKYQWDLIHNPETILLGFMQDESEVAKILIEKSDKFVGILERIRCAYKTNQTFDYDKPLGFVNGILRHEGITLGDGHTYQEISLVMKDDVIACDPRNVSIDKKTNFYNFLFRGFSINVVGATDGQQLEKYLFDTSEAEYNTQQAKAIVKLHNELSKPTPDVDAATSLLYGLSDCTLQQLTSTIREKSLALLLEGAGAYLPKWNERIIISLIRSALYDKGKAKSLYDCLCQKPALLYGLYDRTSFLRGEFIEALTLLCAQNWTQEQLDGLSADRYYITGSKELTLRSRFNDSKALDIWQLWANDNFKKSNSCNGIPPLTPIGLGDDCSSCSAGDIAYMPAIYVQSLTDAADVQSIKALANAALTFAGATDSVNLLLNSSRLVKILGVIELANLTADGVLANPLVRARLAQTENGNSFLQVWPYVNMGIDLATVSTDILVNFVNSGRKAAAVLDELPANNVANRLDEAEELLRKRGVTTAGDELANALRNWDNLTLSEVKTIYSKISYSEIVGSKIVKKQDEILQELEMLWESQRNAGRSFTINPYSFIDEIADYSLTKEALFVRVHSLNNPNRPWLIAIEDFKKFTSQNDMISKLALPILGDGGKIIKPTELSIVKLPVGTKIRRSIARPQDWPGLGHQSGGAVQFEIRDNLNIPPDWFKNIGKISDYLQ